MSQSVNYKKIIERKIKKKSGLVTKAGHSSTKVEANQQHRHRADFSQLWAACLHSGHHCVCVCMCVCVCVCVCV